MGNQQDRSQQQWCRHPRNLDRYASWWNPSSSAYPNLKANEQNKTSKQTERDRSQKEKRKRSKFNQQHIHQYQYQHYTLASLLRHLMPMLTMCCLYIPPPATPPAFEATVVTK